MKEKSTNCGVYKITNVLNSNAYIGSSSNLKSRKYVHLYNLKNNKSHNNHLQSSYNLYGGNNFEWVILKYIEKIEDKKLLKEELLKWENFYINDSKYKGIELYNTREKVESNLGYTFSEETKEKLRQLKLGKKHSEESKEKMRKPKSEETKEKMRKPKSKEHIDKIRKIRFGSKHSEETKEKMKESRRRYLEGLIKLS